MSVEVRLEKLSSAFKKQSDEACASCHYDPDYILRLGSVERMFCERCLVDALLDAMNFQFYVPAL